MKVYLKCDKCEGNGRIPVQGYGIDNSMRCGKCMGSGVVPVDIPLEQALKALRSARTMISKAVYPGTREIIEKEIKALEECIK